MKLSQVTIPTVKVPTPSGDEFEIRGISLSDVILLLHEHAPEMMIVYAKLRESDDEMLVDDVRNVMSNFAREFPDLLAAIIALAADSYDDAGLKVARRLNMETQIDALEKVFKLTFASESSLEKLVQSVVKALQGVTRAVEQARLPTSEAGSGDFDDL